MFVFMRLKNSYKIILPVLSVIVFLISLEIVLRLGGFFFILLQENKNKIELAYSNKCRVLCVGESTTALGGKYSYPYILGQFLNSNSGTEFCIINKGVPGTNSVAIVKQMPEYINRYKPQIIVAMMGINDYDYNNVIVQSEKIGAIYKFTSSLRIYKLFHLINSHLAGKAVTGSDNTVFSRGLSKGPVSKNRAVVPLSGEARVYYERGILYSLRGLYNEALIMYGKAMDENSEFLDTYMQLGWTNLILGQFDVSEKYFRKAVLLDPSNDSVHAALGFSLFRQRKFTEAEGVLRKAIEINCYNDKAYVDLGQCYIYENKYKEAESVFKMAIKANPDCDRAFGALALVYLKEQEYALANKYFNQANRIRLEFFHPETRESFKKLKDIAKENRCILVCVQYPMRNVEALKAMFNSTEGVYFVDNESSFKKRVEQEGYEAYFVDRFAGDFGHCSRKGNDLLAANVGRVIMGIANE